MNDIYSESKETRGQIAKYTVIRSIGRGGEGDVYLARDEDLQRLVAIKRIRQPGQEADILPKLTHPMFPAVYDLLWDDGWYLVMEYIQGITLRGYVERNGYVQEEQACAWMNRLLETAEYMHTRKPPVIYRDFKPDNIMVCLDRSLRLVDFGAAVRQDYGGGGGGVMAATQGYAAPEQLGRTKRGVYADERSDIYAIGKVMYYMMTGSDPARPPYTSLSLREYQPLAQERVERMIRKCIEEKPDQRYQTAGEVRKELDRCAGRRGRLRRRSFIRAVEKKIWLTEMRT